MVSLWMNYTKAILVRSAQCPSLYLFAMLSPQAFAGSNMNT